MAKMTIAMQGIEVNAMDGQRTKVVLDVIIQDHPKNISNHLHLLGLLSVSILVISDDTGVLTIEAQGAKPESSIFNTLPKAEGE